MHVGMMVGKKNGISKGKRCAHKRSWEAMLAAAARSGRLSCQ